jgi:hypothetical protein
MRGATDFVVAVHLTGCRAALVLPLCDACCYVPAPGLGAGRAAASVRQCVEVIERRVVQAPLLPTRRDSPRLFAELVGQLNDGRIYGRDLPGLARVLEPVLQAYRQRAHMTGAPTVY